MVTDIHFFRLMLRREWLLRWRRRHEMVLPVLFFSLTLLLFPLATTIKPEALSAIGAGVIWVVALLALLLTLPRLFEQDYHDGSLSLLIISDQLLFLALLAKALVHFVCIWLPIMLTLPIVSLLFGLTWPVVRVLALTLTVALPFMCLVGLLVAALLVSLRGCESLLALLLVPLYIPSLLISHVALTAVAWHQSAQSPILVLLAMSILSLSLLPWLSGAALRVGLTGAED